MKPMEIFFVILPNARMKTSNQTSITFQWRIEFIMYPHTPSQPHPMVLHHIKTCQEVCLKHKKWVLPVTFKICKQDFIWEIIVIPAIWTYLRLIQAKWEILRQKSSKSANLLSPSQFWVALLHSWHFCVSKLTQNFW